MLPFLAAALPFLAKAGTAIGAKAAPLAARAVPFMSRIAAKGASVPFSVPANQNMAGLYGTLGLLQSLGGVMQGASQFDQGNQTAEGLANQLAQYEQQYQLDQRSLARRALSVAAQQELAYASSGVRTDTGSPLDVLANTYRLSGEELDALAQRQSNIRSTLQANIRTARRGGRAGLFGGLLSGGTSALSTLMLGQRLGIFGAAPSTSGSGGGSTLPLPPVSGLGTPNFPYRGTP